MKNQALATCGNFAPKLVKQPGCDSVIQGLLFKVGNDQRQVESQRKLIKEEETQERSISSVILVFLARSN